MSTISPNDSNIISAGIRGSSSSAMLGVNNSNLLANGSAQRKTNMQMGDNLNNSQNLDGMMGNSNNPTKKLG